ncbi:MAG TPA: hypothetical protein VKA73_02710 [Rubrobacter sp.]|nr:hypothetical protein [Rubrobacter sp.]
MGRVPLSERPTYQQHFLGIPITMDTHGHVLLGMGDGFADMVEAALG